MVVQTKDQYGDVVHVPNMKVRMTVSASVGLLFSVPPESHTSDSVLSRSRPGGGEGCSCFTEEVDAAREHEEAAAAAWKLLAFVIWA